jgi:hypothetical protein
MKVELIFLQNRISFFLDELAKYLVLESGAVPSFESGVGYPNHIVLPQDSRAYERVLKQLGEHFGVKNGTPDQIEDAAGKGVPINPAVAAALVAPIKTNSRNTWRDGTIADVMKKVAGAFGNRITLRFRTADRTVREDGFISTGTLSGAELRDARNAAVPTLWIPCYSVAP